MPSTAWRWGLATLSAATLGLGLQANYRLNDRADCLARYNVAIANRSLITGHLTDEQNAAVNELLTGAINQDAFKARTDAVAAERAEHPPPALPADCR